MKTTYLILLMFFAIAGAAFAADPYDYWVAIAQVPDVTTTTNVVKTVVVFVGNRGPFSGPYYDVTLTVKKAGSQSVVCSAGLATQSPLQKNQQRNVLAFQLSYPNGRVLPDPTLARLRDKYIVFADIRTQYPNDDTNAGNGTQSKEFSFPISGTPACKPM